MRERWGYHIPENPFCIIASNVTHTLDIGGSANRFATRTQVASHDVREIVGLQAEAYSVVCELTQPLSVFSGSYDE
jgi:hypothetical protein